MMNIDTKSIVTATEANQNFSRVARLAEKRGKVVVFKNNRPKLLVIDLDTEPQIEMSEDEKLEFVAGKVCWIQRLREPSPDSVTRNFIRPKKKKEQGLVIR